MNVLGFIYGKYRNYTLGEEVEIVHVKDNSSITPCKVGDKFKVIKLHNKEEYSTLCRKKECNNSSIKQCIGMYNEQKNIEIWTCYCDIVPYRKGE